MTQEPRTRTGKEPLKVVPAPFTSPTLTVPHPESFSRPRFPLLLVLGEVQARVGWLCMPAGVRLHLSSCTGSSADASPALSVRAVRLGRSHLRFVLLQRYYYT